MALSNNNWSADDLAAALGDWESEVRRIAQHERGGSVYRRDGSLRQGAPPRPRQPQPEERDWPPPLPSAIVVPRAAPRTASRGCDRTDRSECGLEPAGALPLAQRHPLDIGPSHGLPPISLPNLPPEALLKQMSPSEKDRLLHHLLTSHRARTAKAESEKERDMLDVQEGIWRSYKEGDTARSRREELDKDALQFGIQASMQEFGDTCQRQHREREMDRRLVDEIKSKSLATSSSSACELEARLIEEAKRASLSSSQGSSFSKEEEECLLEEAKRESLQHPPLNKEERLIEEAKRASLFDAPSVAAIEPTAFMPQNASATDDSSSRASLMDDRKPAARKVSPSESLSASWSSIGTNPLG